VSDSSEEFDEQRKAERELLRAVAAEKKAERELRQKIQMGFYGCMGLAVLIFLLLMFFTGK